MDNLNLLADDDVSKDGKERKNSRECCFSIDDKERNVIDFETIGEISHTSSSFIGVRDDDHFMASVDKFLQQW